MCVWAWGSKRELLVYKSDALSLEPTCSVECMELFLQFLMHLHGMVLNKAQGHFCHCLCVLTLKLILLVERERERERPCYINQDRKKETGRKTYKKQWGQKKINEVKKDMQGKVRQKEGSAVLRPTRFHTR
jgi:hypothetical protein